MWALTSVAVLTLGTGAESGSAPSLADFQVRLTSFRPCPAAALLFNQQTRHTGVLPTLLRPVQTAILGTALPCAAGKVASPPRFHLPEGTWLRDLPLEEIGKPGNSLEALEWPKFSAVSFTGSSRLGCGLALS